MKLLCLSGSPARLDEKPSPLAAVTLVRGASRVASTRAVESSLSRRSRNDERLGQ